MQVVCDQPVKCLCCVSSVSVFRAKIERQEHVAVKLYTKDYQFSVQCDPNSCTMTPTQEHPRIPPPVRPRISITVPPAYMMPQQHHQPISAQYSPAHYFQQFQQPVGVIPTTPGSRISVAQDPNQPQGPPDYPDYYSMYPAKAGEFMFKQFEGFRDFTYNTAKSGLGVGEKSVFWLYTKITKWSRNWFTHIFLFLMLFLYSVAGAALFIAVEGKRK